MQALERRAAAHMGEDLRRQFEGGQHVEHVAHEVDQRQRAASELADDVGDLGDTERDRDPGEGGGKERRPLRQAVRSPGRRSAGRLAWVINAGSSIELDPNDPNTVWVGTGEANVRNSVSQRAAVALNEDFVVFEGQALPWVVTSGMAGWRSPDQRAVGELLVA